MVSSITFRPPQNRPVLSATITRRTQVIPFGPTFPYSHIIFRPRDIIPPCLLTQRVLHEIILVYPLSHFVF